MVGDSMFIPSANNVRIILPKFKGQRRLFHTHAAFLTLFFFFTDPGQRICNTVFRYILLRLKRITFLHGLCLFYECYFFLHFYRIFAYRFVRYILQLVCFTIHDNILIKCLFFFFIQSDILFFFLYQLRSSRPDTNSGQHYQNKY